MWRTGSSPRQLTEVIAAGEDLEAYARRVPGGHTRKWIGEVLAQTRAVGAPSATSTAAAAPLVYSSALASTGRPAAPQRNFAEGCRTSPRRPWRR